MTANTLGENLSKSGSKLSKMNYPTFILDNGHGGVINGEYQTKGKRSPVWPDGRQLFEGEFNRDIVNRLILKMKMYQIPFYKLVDTEEDTPLEDRTDEANYFYKTNPNCILISVHANAASNPKATGFEIFTSPGQTDADPYAEILIEEYKKKIPELKLRDDDDDGDHDKEAKFWMVVETKMPAVLIETSFMTCLSPDCELLMSDDGRQRIANAIFNGILRICQEKK